MCAGALLMHVFPLMLPAPVDLRQKCTCHVYNHKPGQLFAVPGIAVQVRSCSSSSTVLSCVSKAAGVGWPLTGRGRPSGLSGTRSVCKTIPCFAPSGCSKQVTFPSAIVDFTHHRVAA